MQVKSYPIESLQSFSKLLIDYLAEFPALAKFYGSSPQLESFEQQILEKAGLWKRDSQTGKEGYTLACALLLGKDEVIQTITHEEGLANAPKKDTDYFRVPKVIEQK